MQLYAGLPIITNKITAEEQQGVPHHLLGCIGLHEQTWVVGTFVKGALKVIDEIRSRGKLPILVGGTHYYTQSLLFRDRLAEDDEVDDEREILADTSERWPFLREPTEVLLEELKRVDPVMADRWHPNDRRKIQRSMEIYLQTGRKASEIYAEQRERRSRTRDRNDPCMDRPSMRFNSLLFWIHSDPDILQKRLDRRVDKMLESGLLDEVRTLNAFRAAEEAQGSPVDESRGIWVSIGYKEFRAYSQALDLVNDNTMNLEKAKADAVEKTKIATRQYAKRQLRWIRIKLVNALNQADARQSLYLLNGSDASAFEENVVQLASRLIGQFLTASPMPDPPSFSETAAEMLKPKQSYDLSATPSKWIRQHCELCGVTCVTEDQWTMHVKSKAHRKLASKGRAEPEKSNAELYVDHPSTVQPT